MLKKCGLFGLAIAISTCCSLGAEPLRQKTAPKTLPFVNYSASIKSIGAFLNPNKSFSFLNYKVGNTQVLSQNILSTNPGMVGEALPYPNPAPNLNIILAYMLSGPMDVEVRIYSSLGVELKRVTAKKNAVGGSLGYNKLPITLISSTGVEFSNGIYYVAVIDSSKNKVVSKTKIAVSR